MIPAMHIATDSPVHPDVRSLLDEHLSEMRATSPPESVHALDHSALLAPSITFWTARDTGGALLGCVALSELSPTHGEVKSMRTTTTVRGRGVGAALVLHILTEGRARGYDRLSLETGSQEFFAPARRLYTRHGFTECGPFANYAPDPSSTFMTLTLP